MRRAQVILVLAGLSWAGVAGVLGSGALSQSRPPVPASGPSPACLPATLERSGAIAGTPLNVSPAPDSGSASPRTQISFLGAPVTAVSDVTATGSLSGHPRRRPQRHRRSPPSLAPRRSKPASCRGWSTPPGRWAGRWGWRR